MVPDKIYIPNKIDFVSAAILKTKNAPDDITFIRKDALLEWARNSRDSAGKLSYTEFIDKLNSM